MRTLRTLAVRSLVLSLCVVAGLAACAKKAAPPPPAPAPAPVATSATVKVESVTLGRAIGADKRITETVSVFAPADTIFASVVTTGTSPKVVLGARWTYDLDQLVKEDKLEIAPTGPEVSEFHIGRPDGWPAGPYKVEISVDGVVSNTQSFTVQ